MCLSTNKINCLIVEDDKFKIDSVCSFLNDVFPNRVSITECHALATASVAINDCIFDLAMIDMSIHSHEPEAGAGSPVPLTSGGLDVLFEVNFSKKTTHCIILTQYPDIPIAGEPIPVEFSTKEILDKFEIIVAGCVQYNQNDQKWKTDITSILKRLDML